MISAVMAAIWSMAEGMPAVDAQGELEARQGFSQFLLSCHPDYEQDCLGPCATYCDRFGDVKSNCNICRRAACTCDPLLMGCRPYPDLICAKGSEDSAGEDAEGVVKSEKSWPAEIEAGEPAEIDTVDFDLTEAT